MQDTLSASTHVIVRHAHGMTCPCCKSPVYRVPRRLLDRLLSIVRPLRRYCCRSLVCGWEGNLRRAQHDSCDRGRHRLEPSAMGNLKQAGIVAAGATPR